MLNQHPIVNPRVIFLALFLGLLFIPNIQSQEKDHHDLYLKGSVKLYTQKEFWAKNAVDSLSKGELTWDEYEIVQFTPNGKISEIRYYNSNDKFIQRTKHQYNSKGYLTKLIVSDSMNQLLGRIVYKHDKEGNRRKLC